MAKVRVHELAKELDSNSKEIIGLMSGFGFPTRNHMSSLEQEELDVLFERLTQSYDGKVAIPVFAKVKEEAPKPAKKKKEKTAKESTEAVEISDDTTKLDEPIGRKVRHVDTRQTVVELNKIDDEIIEELIPENISDDGIKKQKLKKGKDKLRDNNQVKNKAKVNKEEKVKKGLLTVKIPDEIGVGELAERLQVPATEVIKKLMMLGVMASISQSVDYEIASLIAEDFGAIVEKEIILTREDILFNDFEDTDDQLETRSPVVVVMGHVDHGKTSLLDAIRSTNVIDTEAGGITQHIGAYRVRINDRKITFLDTPGHEAFTAMRARGAQVTDIAILVVAADDGIMPQTIEAINHAKAANLGIIVAINKIDKDGANPDRIKQELTEHGLVPEDWGGDTICVEISAKQRLNIEELLEMVILVADMKELKANPNRRAKGTVIESKLDKGRGPVASILVQNGTLKAGDTVVAGTSFGHIRAMFDDKGKPVKKAGPSVPVEILGLDSVPEGGEVFYAVEDERMAKQVIEARKQKIKEERLTQSNVVTLDDFFNKVQEGQIKDLNIVIKADVQGSVEAVKQSLEKLSNEEVRVNVIHAGVGAVRESDVMLAYASNAIIVGFNVRPDAGALSSAEDKGVDIRLYRVIYTAIEELEAAMKGMLDPTYKEEVTGHAEIRQTFRVSGVGTIAGCYVTDGSLSRNTQVRIVRDGIVVHEGELASLKRFKDDVKEVNQGYECGLSIERYNDIKEGDIVEGFKMVEVER